MFDGVPNDCCAARIAQAILTGSADVSTNTMTEVTLQLAAEVLPPPSLVAPYSDSTDAATASADETLFSAFFVHRLLHIVRAPFF